MNTDPIRARLDSYHRPGGVFADTVDALRAVLDLCDDWSNFFGPADLRDVIADALGTDRDRGGAA